MDFSDKRTPKDKIVATDFIACVQALKPYTNHELTI
jgi:hypothetical protein